MRFYYHCIALWVWFLAGCSSRDSDDTQGHEGDAGWLSGIIHSVDTISIAAILQLTAKVAALFAGVGFIIAFILGALGRRGLAVTVLAVSVFAMVASQLLYWFAAALGYFAFIIAAVVAVAAAWAFKKYAIPRLEVFFDKDFNKDGNIGKVVNKLKKK